MAVKKKVKVKRTKWTPKRFYLLLAWISSPLWGFIFWPLVIIGPIWVGLAWKQVWSNEDYGYKSNGKFDWSFWF
jgi:hypothetical protein